MPYVSALQAGRVESIITLSGKTIGADFNDRPEWGVLFCQSGCVAADAKKTRPRRHLASSGIDRDTGSSRFENADQNLRTCSNEKGREHQSILTPQKKPRQITQWIYDMKNRIARCHAWNRK
jgi:hypothetical protein